MTGVDSSELILLLIIGLIVLGPKRLPEIANKIGGWLGQARRMTRVLKRQLEEELSLDENPTIGPPVATPPSMAKKPVAEETDDDAVEESAAAEDEPVQHHIPSDDDTYSELHEADEPEQEKPA